MNPNPKKYSQHEWGPERVLPKWEMMLVMMLAIVQLEMGCWNVPVSLCPVMVVVMLLETVVEVCVETVAVLLVETVAVVCVETLVVVAVVVVRAEAVEVARTKDDTLDSHP